MKIIEIENFLDDYDLTSALAEVSNIEWPKLFNRAGSVMFENNNIDSLPVLRSLYYKFSTPKFLSYLEKEFNIQGVLPDPYLIGAGYSKIEQSNDLKFHIDFNWNDVIKLHRVCSLIIYLNEVHGGDLELENLNTVVTSKNKAIIFEHSETVRHRVTNCNSTRYALRLFYYASKMNMPVDGHRSLYGFLDGKAVDI